MKKYLLYAIGEVLLVMIGILLALQVNNWNQTRIQKSQIDAQLLNLKTSLALDWQSLNNSSELNAFRFHFTEYILKWSGQTLDQLETLRYGDTIHISGNYWNWPQPNPDTLNKEYIELGISWLTRGFSSIVIDRSAINEINNLGLFSEIENEELKKKINEYYRLIDWNFNDRRIERQEEFEKDIFQYLRDNYNLRTQDISEIPDPIEFIKNDEGLIFRIQELRSRVRWHYVQAKSARNLAREIMDMIEKELT